MSAVRLRHALWQGDCTPRVTVASTRTGTRTTGRILSSRWAFLPLTYLAPIPCSPLPYLLLWSQDNTNTQQHCAAHLCCQTHDDNRSKATCLACFTRIVQDLVAKAPVLEEPAVEEPAVEEPVIKIPTLKSTLLRSLLWVIEEPVAEEDLAPRSLSHSTHNTNNAYTWTTSLTSRRTSAERITRSPTKMMRSGCMLNGDQQPLQYLKLVWFIVLITSLIDPAACCYQSCSSSSLVI